jgi:hypothetical protein
MYLYAMLLGAVDCSKLLSPPTFRGLSAKSMDPVDKPRGVGYGVNCQQTLVLSIPI